MEVFRSAFITKCSELSTEPSAIVLNQLKYEISNAKKGGNQVNEKLDLSGHPLHIKTITALCTALQTDVIFTNLIFSDAFLGDGGAIIIAGALKTNTTVKMLDLRGNNIRSDGATALAQMMKVNTTLETLLLEWNCIGIWEVGAKALGDALPINQYLQHLDLRNCKIGPQSAICLSQGLRHNTNLRILDLRWNNVGIIGGRAFVEALKWNMVITEIELTGNEIPDDVLRSIGIALDRNRDRFKHLLQNKVHSEHLSSTLQALTTAHHSNLEQLSTKLSASDGRAQTLSEKLSQTSRELSEMLEYRKNADARLRELEVELSHERKESSKQLSDLQTELLKEKDRRLKLEDKLTISSSSMNGRMIELEANLRETEMKAEVLRRDKTMLLEEMDKAKEREKSIYELHKEKMARMEANHTNRLNALTEAKDAEIKELTKRLEEKFKNVQTEKQRLEEEIDALKTKAINEKRQLIDKFSETETRIKKEEDARRKELETQIDSLRQSQHQLQTDLSSLSTSKNALLRDHEFEVKRLTDQKVELNEQVANLRSAQVQMQSDTGTLRKQLDEANRTGQALLEKVAQLQKGVGEKVEEVTKTKTEMRVAEEKFVQALAQKDAAIAKLKEHLRRLEHELDDEHESQSLRMKDLAIQINSLIGERQRRMRNRSPEIAQ